MSDLAPLLQGFFTENWSGSARPAHTPSPPTATRSSCCSPSPASAPAGNRPSWASPTWTPPRSARSCNTSKASGATRPRPEIPAWPRSTRSSATPRCTTPNTRR